MSIMDNGDVWLKEMDYSKQSQKIITRTEYSVWFSGFEWILEIDVYGRGLLREWYVLVEYKLLGMIFPLITCVRNYTEEVL